MSGEWPGVNPPRRTRRGPGHVESTISPFRGDRLRFVEHDGLVYGHPAYGDKPDKDVLPRVCIIRHTDGTIRCVDRANGDLTEPFATIEAAMTYQQETDDPQSE